jgi:NAD-dependent dihydropyrimidine dehydrogenase PreA subunit
MPLQYLKNVVTLDYDPIKCTGCGRCQEVCPHAVFVMDGGRAVVTDRDSCMECGACSRNCAPGAVTVRAGVGCAWAIARSKLFKTEVACCD